MAKLKAARATDVPSAMPEPDIAADLDGLAAASAASSCSCIRGGAEAATATTTTTTTAAEGRPPLVVIGHRGKGMNTLVSTDPRLRGDVRENTLRAFNDAAASHPAVAYVEFDVQVTKDGCPVIFHDNFIYTQQDGEISGKRVTDLDLDEFLSYGPQREKGKAGKPLLRKLKDGRILKWDVRSEDALCTLREVFQGVHRRVGFNVELKFDDDLVYTEDRLTCILQAVLKVVFDHADDRSIIFSSFQPDAAQLIRKLQDKYPVFFLTNGGTQVYADPRRNSLEEAVKLCVAGGLQGIVSEVRAITQAAVGGGQDQGGQQAVADDLRPAQVSDRSVCSQLFAHSLQRRPAARMYVRVGTERVLAVCSLFVCRSRSNVPEVVYVQHLMGVDGVIVDLVREIADAVSAFTATAVHESGSQDGGGVVVGERMESAAVAVAGTPSFSPREMSFLLRLIPELVQ